MLQYKLTFHLKSFLYIHIHTPLLIPSISNFPPSYQKHDLNSTHFNSIERPYICFSRKMYGYRIFFSLLLLILLQIITTNKITCHGRIHHHQHKHEKSNPKQLTINMTKTYESEMEFMKWVNFVGSLKHTLFKTAINKLFPSYILTVSKNPNTGDFTTIQDAIDSLPLINLVRVIIKVKSGIYEEKVNIPQLKAFVSIEGEGADNTIVEWGDTAQTIGPNGRQLGTFGSATFAVNSPYFIAKNITFKNTYPAPAPGAIGKQAVAFRISADTAAFVGCKFLGAQDTLYDHFGRHYYKDCYIEGTVDFIFGNGLSLFEGCEVHAIAQKLGAVTAQGRKSMLDDTGFSFVNCKVTGSGVLYLGRAWGPFSRVVFAYTYMDNIIIPKGWSDWGDPNRDMTVYYGQYKCKGPGASFAGRVAWSKELTDDEAKPFLSLNFIDGSEWIVNL
ncbi:hypothetical protein RND81_06G164400 [Saponaria officinalis]|uniref:Pectinesterase n=1 Tax=Saponaria officinalis TaxID=3572 RepID=A0AAW1KDZ8_SAPOF